MPRRSIFAALLLITTLWIAWSAEAVDSGPYRDPQTDLAVALSPATGRDTMAIAGTAVVFLRVEQPDARLGSGKLHIVDLESGRTAAEIDVRDARYTALSHEGDSSVLAVRFLEGRSAEPGSLYALSLDQGALLFPGLGRASRAVEGWTLRSAEFGIGFDANRTPRVGETFSCRVYLAAPAASVKMRVKGGGVLAPSALLLTESGYVDFIAARAGEATVSFTFLDENGAILGGTGFEAVVEE